MFKKRSGSLSSVGWGTDRSSSPSESSQKDKLPIKPGASLRSQFFFPKGTSAANSRRNSEVSSKDVDPAIPGPSSRPDQPPLKTPVNSTTSSESAQDFVRVVAYLRHVTRKQAREILSLRQRLQIQDAKVTIIEYQKCEQMKHICSKLVYAEACLAKKQKEIVSMLQQRDHVIHQQKVLIENLTSRLNENGIELPPGELTEINTNLPDLESVNDSDSAVVLEEMECEMDLSKSRLGDTTKLMRSISDAMEPGIKNSLRRNGFLRRPDILETVYSVEEDVEDDEPNKEAKEKRAAFATKGKSSCGVDDKETQDRTERVVEEKSNNTEQDNDDDKTKTNQVKTYNRVMSNHRSVTKPKDVKYKRINKAKSKSLEELRGKLKTWVEQGTKLPLDQSQIKQFDVATTI